MKILFFDAKFHQNVPDLVKSDGVLKGSLDTIVEDDPSDNLAPPGDLEENASHHVGQAVNL